MARRLKVAKYLVEECDINPDATDRLGRTSLTVAVSSGFIDIVKYLVSTGKCDVNHTTRVTTDSVYWCAVIVI